MTLADTRFGSTGAPSFMGKDARGGGVRPHRPSTNPVPAGATEAGRRYRWGRALTRPSPWFVPPAGATDAGRTPHSDQALPSLKATNFVPSPDFTRISTVRLPSRCALPTATRISEGEATLRPATSRLTSPALKPFSAATPSGSTWVTTTPPLPLPAT